MNEKIKKKLITQIERLCEMQYRKGFQQGFYASDKKQLTERQVDEFRNKGAIQGYKKVADPHTKMTENAKDRLLCEIQMTDMDELYILLSGVDIDK